MSFELEGMVSKAVKVEGDDDKYLVTINPAAVDLLNVDAGDSYAIALAGALFKHLFASSFNPGNLKPEDFYIQLQVPKQHLSKEVRLVLESGRGIDFNLSPVEVPPEDEITKFVPKVIIKE